MVCDVHWEMSNNKLKRNKRFFLVFVVVLKIHALIFSAHRFDGITTRKEFCIQIFASKVALEYHLKSLHRVEEQWMCKHCKKTFNMKHSLNVHVRNVHSMKTFVCKICSKVFSRLSHFIRHAKYVHGEHRNYFVLDDSPVTLY